jgi:hypothetical protein
MSRRILPLLLLVLLLGVACTACAKTPAGVYEITDPAEAAKEADFKIQGEYVGEGTWTDGEKAKAGAQVIALGDGAFAIVVTKGGLPGDGWKRGDARFGMEGKRSANASNTKLTGAKSMSGEIAGGAMTIAGGKANLELKRTERHSATEGAKPPKGAVVLFDGTTADKLEHGKMSKDKNLMSEAVSKQKFSDHTMHLEFRLSYMPRARGQARSNSGVYVHDCYEIQVLDSFGLEGEDNECGGFYQIRKPDVNMCYPPLTWQTYDIDFIAPKYEGDKKVSDAKVDVRQNGVVIHPDFILQRATPGREDEGPAPRPVYLQGHGNKVEYRNIWVEEKR